MSRRRETPKRKILPDPRYNDRILAKFINAVCWKAKKSVAEKIVYGSFDLIEKRMKEEPLRVFKKALENVKPAVEVKPTCWWVNLPGSNGNSWTATTALAFRWLINFARKRHEKTMMEKLAGEFMDAAANRGASIKKKDDTHKMADANKAFAHYRW